jgi:hypothetical protein
MTSKIPWLWRNTLVPLAAISVMTAQQPASQTNTSVPQQPASTGSQSLGDVARQQRAAKNGEASTTPPDAGAPGQTQKSLAEVAAERRTNKPAEIKVTEKETEGLFAEVDTILEFASQDSGLPRRAAVKRRLVSQDDVKRYMSSAMANSAETQRIARSEIVLKKFGYLPPTFDLKSYLISAAGQSIAGYYDFRTKTMNLLSWVGLEKQRPIMAHELTHALQDQNYDLLTWSQRHQSQPAMRVLREEAQEGRARTAVVEGQAMIVFMDYLLKPYGRTLSDTPLAEQYIKNQLAQTYDASVVIHNAPLMLRETALFPYREGLLFELELLHRGGTELAFASTFSRPPANTHEILEPKAYLEGEKIPAVTLPDLSRVLANDYEVYDSGTMGQLDVRILSQQLGSENDMFTVTPNWRGGAYVAVKRKSPVLSPGGQVSTADIALMYVSRWKTLEAAERFMETYQKSLSKRVKVIQESPTISPSCAGPACPPRAVRVDTSEGLAFLELLPNNTVFIAQSFPEETVKSLRQIVLTRAPENSASSSAPDLTLRLLEMPAFAAFQEQVAGAITGSLLRHSLADEARPNDQSVASWQELKKQIRLDHSVPQELGNECHRR